MKQTTWICDKCGQEITDVVYTLTCYAHDATPLPMGGISAEAAGQNALQNMSDTGERHMCRTCKDAITDGVFIV